MTRLYPSEFALSSFFSELALSFFFLLLFSFFLFLFFLAIFMSASIGSPFLFCGSVLLHWRRR